MGDGDRVDGWIRESQGWEGDDGEKKKKGVEAERCVEKDE